MTEIHSSWKRDFDVYERIEKLEIDLGKKGDSIGSPAGNRISQMTFTPSGLVFLSGTGAGLGSLTNDDDDVRHAKEMGREAGILHLRSLHWGLDPYGNLNDIWYFVKALGMVNSHGGGSFSKSHLVVDGYSFLFHDVFGGPMSQFAQDGEDRSFSGWHARSAIAGFDLPGHVMVEPEMIVQIDPGLALGIIRDRGPQV